MTVEQCRRESAMLLFTVMDYDVLTANDFAGEALLSLNTIPGVATTPQGLDTFHGLKQIDLVLMFQQNKRKINYFYLILFSRTIGKNVSEGDAAVVTILLMEKAELHL